ncbi:MAG TPA: hypothetical protein VEU50_44010 [Archangium sp.]|nr:hypothetical protein [Archangium sp.]HYO59749.1 hypothetical protein [Archangium sp.]
MSLPRLASATRSGAAWLWVCATMMFVLGMIVWGEFTFAWMLSMTRLLAPTISRLTMATVCWVVVLWSTMARAWM